MNNAGSGDQTLETQTNQRARGKGAEPWLSHRRNRTATGRQLCHFAKNIMSVADPIRSAQQNNVLHDHCSGIGL